MGVRKNFAYNLVLTFFNFLFPLITYPYVTRILGVENIGICNFVDNFINYALILSNLGITVYGVREIARQSDDMAGQTEVFSSLFAINCLLSALAIVVLCVLTFFVPFFFSYKDYLLVGAGKIVFNVFLVEWFFQGLQKFKFITLRSVGVRFLFVLAVLLWVKDKEDTLLYFILMCATTVVGGVLDWIYSGRFVSFSFSSVNIRKYFVTVIIFGIYMVLTAMYTNFNTIYLGLVSNDTQVGYFGVASKLHAALMALFTAFTTVMVPRVSYLLKQEKMQLLQDITDRIFKTLCAVSFPMIVYSLFFADEIVWLIAGDGFEGAVPVFRVMSVIFLIIAIEQIVIGQFLLSSDSTSAVTAVCSTGAIVGLGINFLITPRFEAIGSSVSWGISEMAVLCAGLVLVKKNMGITLDFKRLGLELIKSLVYVISLVPLFVSIKDGWCRFGAGTTIVVLEFFLMNLVFGKDELMMEAAGSLVQKFRRV